MRYIGILLFIALFVGGCGESAPAQSPTSLLTIDDNLDAINAQAGMVYGQDFTVEQNYMATFVATVFLDDFSIEGTNISYKQAKGIPDFTPYFAWVCYPQITKDSQATVIFLEDVGGSTQASGDFTVRAVNRIDTTRALVEFGGTYGTKQKGW